MSIGSGSLFFILLLCRIMDIAYCMAMTLISLTCILILSLRILNVVSILSIERVCVVALAPPAMTNSGFTFHPLLIILSIRGFIFIFFGL